MVDKGRFGNKLDFKYKSVLTPFADGKWRPVPKPKIEIIFRRFAETKHPEKNREIKLNALIDSGADYSFLPLEIATLLRLDIDEPDQTISTIIGDTKVYQSKVHVEIPLHKKRPIVVGNVETFVLPEMIKGKKPPEDLIILGRKDFFDMFEVTFHEPSKRITLKPIMKRIEKKRLDDFKKK